MATLNELKAKVEKSANEASVKMPTNERPEKSVRTLGGSPLDELALDTQSQRVVDYAQVAKKMYEQATGQKIGDAQIKEFRQFARSKAPTLTTDIADILMNTEVLTGRLFRDAYYDTNISKLISMSEVMDLAEVNTINTDDLDFIIAAENTGGTEDNAEYIVEKHYVKKFKGKTSISEEALKRSIINGTQEKIYQLTSSLPRHYENAIINGSLTGTHEDANIAALGANVPAKHFKGLRKIASQKTGTDISFTGAALTDAELAAKFDLMLLAGGIYFTQPEIAAGNVAIICPMNVFLRLSRSTDYSDASKSGGGSTIAGGNWNLTYRGIPIIVSGYMPSLVNATGWVDAVGANNTQSSLLMVNKKFFKGYFWGVPTLKTEEDKDKDVFTFWLNQHLGFNGLMDRPDEIATVRAAATYAIRGVNFLA